MLTQERLARLFTDIQRLASSPEARHGWPIRGAFPAELSDLNPTTAKAQGGEFEVVLKHCMDHRIVLAVPIDKDRQIALYWGEGPTAGQQVLWRQPEP